ncbi:MAB_1171c family putative transporter [Streptomyces sp. NPDC001502]|uniref:MAB_1171c family putative transporter n=1 Tax=Streptomyces sp. NPDC001502 TaxID=3364578 RepID=UPI0036CE8126
MPGEFYFIPVGLLVLASVLRLPALIRNWRDPLLRSVSVVLALGGVVFFFAAPPTIARVNAFVGITNFSAPLVYCLLTAASAAVISLAITWRGGSERRRVVATRWCLGGYGLVMVALFTLFALGDASVERLRDFDTYYAAEPFLREMIVLYVLAHAFATVVLASLCWQWSHDVTGVLRTGLLLIVAGSLLNLGYDACKAIAVGARWAGHDLDTLSTSVAPPLAALSTFCQGVGFALPAISQSLTRQWRSWSEYKRLAPLWVYLRGVAPHGTVRIPWWSSPEKRHLQRTSDILDGLAMLPLNSQIGAEARAQAVAVGATEQRAAATAAAAMVVAALEARHAPGHGDVPVLGPGAARAVADDGPGLLLLSDALRDRGPETVPGADAARCLSSSTAGRE